MDADVSKTKEERDAALKELEEIKSRVGLNFY